jgi:hypothetical protein
MAVKRGPGDSNDAGPEVQAEESVVEAAGSPVARNERVAREEGAIGCQ